MNSSIPHGSEHGSRPGVTAGPPSGGVHGVSAGAASGAATGATSGAFSGAFSGAASGALSGAVPLTPLQSPWGLTPDAGWTSPAKALVAGSAAGLTAFAALATWLLSGNPDAVVQNTGPEQVRIAVEPKQPTPPPTPATQASTPRNQDARNQDARNQGVRNRDARNQDARNQDARNQDARNQDATDQASQSRPPRNRPPRQDASTAGPATTAVTAGGALRGRVGPAGSIPLPGDRRVRDQFRLQVEDFDEGGPGVAYYDTTPQGFGNLARQEQVDGGGAQGVDGQRVSRTDDGEWLNYTVGLSAGRYNVDLGYATGIRRTGVGKVELQLFVDGAFQTLGIWEPESTRGRTNWSKSTLGNIQLPDAEQATLRLHIVEGRIDLDYLDFIRTGDYTGQLQSATDNLIAAADASQLGTPGTGGTPDTLQTFSAPAVVQTIDPTMPPISFLGVPIAETTALVVIADRQMVGQWGPLSRALVNGLSQTGGYPVSVIVQARDRTKQIIAPQRPQGSYGVALESELASIKPGGRADLVDAVKLGLRIEPEEIVLITGDNSTADWEALASGMDTETLAGVKLSIVQIEGANARARLLAQTQGGRFKAVPISLVQSEAQAR